MKLDLLLANALVTLAFAVIFQAPKKEYIFCMITGTVAYLGFLGFESLGLGIASASVVGTFLLTVAARTFSLVRRCPVTVFLMPGIIPLVNGLGIFQMVQALIAGDLFEGASKGMITLTVAVSIALGIVFGFALPQSWFNRLLIRRK